MLKTEKINDIILLLTLHLTNSLVKSESFLTIEIVVIAFHLNLNEEKAL